MRRVYTRAMLHRKICQSAQRAQVQTEELSVVIEYRHYSPQMCKRSRRRTRGYKPEASSRERATRSWNSSSRSTPHRMSKMTDLLHLSLWRGNQTTRPTGRWTD